ncbi:MAG: hypothetical protein ABIJ56_07040 [Pseudomonadota bacterium]
MSPVSAVCLTFGLLPCACGGEFFIEGKDAQPDAPADGAPDADDGFGESGEDAPHPDIGDDMDDAADGTDGAVDTPPDTAPDPSTDPLPDPGPEVDPCSGTTLAERFSVTSVDVSPAGVAGTYYRPSIVLSALDDGTSKAAWNDGSGAAHITPLTAADERAGDDIVIPGSDIAGFVAHADGGALLVVRDDVMALRKVDNSGAVIFDIEFVGNNDHEVMWNKWIDSWSDSGRLAWSGSEYGAYFGHTMLWDSGRHQGDMLQVVDGSGSAREEWGWGCSHSLEVLIAHNGSRFGPVCLSDCYPTKGIHFNHRTDEISPEPSGDCGGGSAARLGGLVPLAGGGFFLTFTSPEGRASDDVVLVRIDTSGGVSVGPEMYLTDTAGVDEHGAKLAAYGPNLLVAWIAGGSTLLAVVGGDGAFVEGPVDVGQAYDEDDDFINFSSGEAGWARGAGSRIEIVRVAVCP